jgi:phosphate transport system ATP-binding protein
MERNRTWEDQRPSGSHEDPRTESMKRQDDRQRSAGPRDQPSDSVESKAQTMEVQGLSCYYGDFKAVTDVNMTIRPNKITALIGPSGCGKSTYLRALNRMHEVSRGGRIEGKVLLDGEDIYGENVDPVQVRRKVGMVFQKPNPFPTMTIYDNVVAGLKLTGRHKKSELDDIVEEKLRQAALWDEVKNKLGASGIDLSGGQQQRLCIARTLAVEPEVILLDEPASALDPMSSMKIEDAMQDLKKRYTLIIVTHNMQQAARASDFTGFFFIEGMGEPGQLWEFGDTEKVFSTPDRQETEDYVTGRFG